MSSPKIAGVHTVNILSFVNECRAGRNPDTVKNHYPVREATYDFRHDRHGRDLEFKPGRLGESRLLFRKDIMMIINVVENKSVLYACLAFTTEQKL